MSYRIAIGTVDGVEVTEHFGKGKSFIILEINQQSDEVVNLGNIEPIYSHNCGQGHDENLIQEKIQGFLDWNVKAVLVKQIGSKSERILAKKGIDVLISSGKVKDVLEKVKKFYKRQNFIKN